MRLSSGLRASLRPVATGSHSRMAVGDAKQEAPTATKYVGRNAKPKGRVFVWGFTYTGALGIPNFVSPVSTRHKPRKIQFTPHRLETDDKIISAACGYGFTLLASKTKDLTKLWGAGLNIDSQIGFHRSRSDRTKSYDYILEPSPVPLPLVEHQQTRVLQVACGRAHSLVLTDNEGVFSMGNNAYGQCGRVIIEDEVYKGSRLIHKIEGIEGKVVEVVCGQDHSLFRTEKGELYACGWGADGQTGLGSYEMCSTPTRLGGDLSGEPVAQVASYGDFCLAVSESGELFGWGNSEYRQLAAITDAVQINVPKRIPFKNVGKVKMAAAGGTICGILNEEGEVFVWGYGILGKGPRLSETETPEQIPPSLFGRTEFDPDIRVKMLRCGLHHFAAVNTRGELFSWGKNLRGCLGIGRPDDQYFPWRVTVAGEVVDVACGVDHSVALAKTLI